MLDKAEMLAPIMNLLPREEQLRILFGEELGIPYTGADAKCMRLCYNKKNVRFPCIAVFLESIVEYREVIEKLLKTILFLALFLSLHRHQ